MNFLFLRIACAIAGTGVAAWQDARTSFIDDKITLGMIGVGATLCFLDVFNAIQQKIDLTPWLWVALVALAIAALGFLAWRAGQFGGGDVLLFIGLHLLLPFNPRSFLPLPYPFIVSVLVAASFFASVYSALWYAKRLRDERALEPRKNALSIAALFLSLLVFALASFSLAQTLFFTALFASAFFLSLYKHELLSRVVVKRLRLSEVEDEDVLAFDELPKRLTAKYSIGRVLSKNEIAKLRAIGRKEKIRFWPVYKELPRFAPFVLLGLLACLAVGDLVFFVLTY
ncbi:MAG: prepilin peptidase [Candidatus Norongarragalinales archaeon]